MKPKKLQQRLSVVNTARVGTLGQKAGNSARPRGRAWMTQRERIAARDGYVCACCGLVWQPSLDQVDHVVELEDGGTNDDNPTTGQTDTPDPESPAGSNLASLSTNPAE